MKKKIMVLVFLIMFTLAFTCTIGVASASVTTDGRALIWKNRDVPSATIVQQIYIDSLQYNFIGISNEQSSYIWMGINEAGFAMVNSVASFNRLPGNGDMMRWALGSCATMSEFEDLLNQTNISGRETHTNYGVLDSSGSAKMYEVSEDHWWSFDADENNGFVVRGNSAFYGGAGEDANHQQSTEIISELIESNQLNCSSVLQKQIRALYYQDQSIEVPYHDYWNDDLPFGYVPFNAQNNQGNKSATVIQSNLPNEPPEFATMWSLLHQPSATIAVPCFAIVPPSAATNTENQAPIHYASEPIYNSLFDNGLSNIDTYKLKNSTQTGFWDELFAFENATIATIDSLRDEWSTNGYEIEDIVTAQENIANSSLEFIQNFEVVTAPIIDFEADSTQAYYYLDVNFRDTSLHNPDFYDWEWDIGADGTIESTEQEFSYTFDEPGEYSILFNATNDNGTFSILKENYIVISEMQPNFESDKEMGLSPLEVNFINLSDANVTDFQWDFDNDGVIDSYFENPTWVYEESGDYSVTLIISNGEYSETITKENFISLYDSYEDIFYVEPDSMVYTQNIDLSGKELTMQNISSKPIEITSIDFLEPYSGFYDFVPLELPYQLNTDEQVTINFFVTNDDDNREFIIDVLKIETNYGESEIDFYLDNSIIDDFEDVETIPEVILTAFPNPFNPKTTIQFNLDKAAFVSLRINNILGQEIRTLVNRNLSEGTHSFEWNGKDIQGNRIGSGIYFCIMKYDNNIKTMKLLLLK